MHLVMRTASTLLPLGSILIASAAFGASPQSPSPTPPVPPSTPASTATQSPELAAPVTSAPAPAPAPTTSQPEAPSAAPKTGPAETQASPASLAASPYGSANSSAAATPKSTPEPAPKVKDQGPPTLFDMHGDYAIGGFGGVGVMYTRFAGHNAVQVCGEGAVIIDHALTLGGGGCGITTLLNADQYGPNGPNDRMTFGYGGAIIRYHLFSNRPINLGVGALIGAGGLTIGTLDGSNDNGPNLTRTRSDAVFVFEPQIGGYANLTRWLRIGVTAGYRIVSSVNTQGLSAGDLSAPTLGGVIQGGWF